MAHQRRVGGGCGCLAKAHGRVVAPHSAVVEESKQLGFAGVAVPIVARLEFADEREFLEPGFELRAVGDIGQVEEPAPQRPPRPSPFHGSAGGVAPGIRRVIECRRVDDRPVEEVAARIVGVAVRIEHVHHGEFADGQDHVVGGQRAAELVRPRADRLAVSSKVEALAQKGALQPHVRVPFPHLVRFAARKAGDAQRVAQAEALVDLGIHVERAAVPQAYAGEQGHVGGLLRVPCRRQAIGPLIRRTEAGVPLFNKSDLAMHVPGFGLVARSGLGRQRLHECSRWPGRRRVRCPCRGEGKQAHREAHQRPTGPPRVHAEISMVSYSSCCGRYRPGSRPMSHRATIVCLISSEGEHHD